MKVLSLAVVAASVFTLTAHARTPEIVIRKAQQLEQLVRRNANDLHRQELNQLENKLDRAIEAARRGNGGGPGGPGGPGYPPPPPTGGQCKLLGRGEANGWTYNFRISLNGTVMEGTNDLDSALSKLDQYVNDRMCMMAVPETCRLGGRGEYSGWTYNFRAIMGNQAVAGANDSGTILTALTKLQNAGVCRRAQANEACQLLGRGEYAGWTYNYRVSVGSTVMAGSNDYNSIRNFIDTMKNNRVCY